METVARLLEKGVVIPNPLTVDIGPEVDPERISGAGVVIHPGCRIRGAATVVSAGVKLGAEGPVTLDDCLLGPDVDLKGGSFSRSVLLAGANMGPGAQVREGCLLEEEANGAHCVGLKQTILLPFVTLGSLVNFCDCLMAGGTSRRDHSEVGSSYVHFNFTPDGDKTTASLFGDVPRGVMLDQPRIFLGGQGGAVGPVRDDRHTGKASRAQEMIPVRVRQHDQHYLTSEFGGALFELSIDIHWRIDDEHLLRVVIEDQVGIGVDWSTRKRFDVQCHRVSPSSAATSASVSIGSGSDTGGGSSGAGKEASGSMPAIQSGSPSGNGVRSTPRRASRSSIQTACQGRGLVGRWGAWESDPAETNIPRSSANRR